MQRRLVGEPSAGNPACLPKLYSAFDTKRDMRLRHFEPVLYVAQCEGTVLLSSLMQRHRLFLTAFN